MRSPSAFSDVSVKPSFLRITPAKKPRTECCCQPVAFMIAGIVAPLGWLSSAMMVAFLELACGAPPRTVLVSAGFLPGLLPICRAADFLVVLLRRIVGIPSSVVTVFGTVTTAAPLWHGAGRAADPEGWNPRVGLELQQRPRGKSLSSLTLMKRRSCSI